MKRRIAKMQALRFLRRLSARTVVNDGRIDKKVASTVRFAPADIPTAGGELPEASISSPKKNGRMELSRRNEEKKRS